MPDSLPRELLLSTVFNYLHRSNYLPRSCDNPVCHIVREWALLRSAWVHCLPLHSGLLLACRFGSSMSIKWVRTLWSQSFLAWGCARGVVVWGMSICIFDHGDIVSFAHWCRLLTGISWVIEFELTLGSCRCLGRVFFLVGRHFGGMFWRGEDTACRFGKCRVGAVDITLDERIERKDEYAR